MDRGGQKWTQMTEMDTDGRIWTIGKIYTTYIELV